MTTDERNDQRPSRVPRRRFVMLERIAAANLVLVVAAVAWMMAAATGARWLRLPSLRAEVGLIIALLTSAMALVTILALWPRDARERSDSR